MRTFSLFLHFKHCPRDFSGNIPRICSKWYEPDTAKSPVTTRFLVGIEDIRSNRASDNSKAPAPTSEKNPSADANEHVDALLPYRQT
ncbi:unnamed protein product [Strongylus vulgaris]|uniref:Uncharacterized protein n=1 Tax=Strongylus vulgaris TaxID=40348 RepID=A0A3P7JG20_STRVU|nr:unnamed protein product [Strongylus vulgaris]